MEDLQVVGTCINTPEAVVRMVLQVIEGLLCAQSAPKLFMCYPSSHDGPGGRYRCLHFMDEINGTSERLSNLPKSSQEMSEKQM